MNAVSALTPDDWDVLRALVAAMQAGRPIYYAVSDAPEYESNMAIMAETQANPWVIVCGPKLAPEWKARIPQLQQAQLTGDGKGVVWGVTA